MAKKYRKKWSRRGAPVIDLVGELAGNVLGQLLSNGIGQYASSDKRDEPKHSKHRGGGWRRREPEEDDVAARVLKVLSDKGPQSIPDLLEETGVGLTALLGAIRDAHEFKLVELVGEEDAIQLTKVGSRTATIVRKSGIRKSASRLLE